MFPALRHALRAIVRMPTVSAVVVVSLAIGIGVNTAIFSWIQAFVFRPLPGVTDSGGFQLVEPRADTGTYPGISWLEYRDLRERLHVFEDVVAFRMTALNVGDRGRLERAYGQLVSGNYFAALGLKPAIGRFIHPEEVERPGGNPVIVISYDYWRTRYGSAPTAIGRSLRVNDRELTIVGVAPEGFQGTVIGLDFDLWVPATLAPQLIAGSRELEDRAVRAYSAIARLKPTATRAQAQADLAGVMSQLAREYPEINEKMSAEVLPFWQSPRGPQRMLVSALALLQAVMLLVLAAVCGNTANLVLARASVRQHEMAVRLALGAGRWRIVRLLLVENVVLACMGAGLGAVVAVWGTNALRVTPISFAFPIRFQTSVNAAGLAFAMVLGLLCGAAFGLVPALHLSRARPHGSLRHGPSVTAGRNVREVLMGVQVALAMIVLVIGALFLQSFRDSRDADPGFTREGVLLAAYDFTGRGVDGDDAREFAARLLDRLSTLPQVEAAAIASSVPLDIHGMPSRSFTLEGRATAAAAPDRALANVVTPEYFAAMRIPLLAGGFASLRDTTAPPQVIVNAEFVRRYVGTGEAMGRAVKVGERQYTIAGIARNSFYEAFGEPPTAMIYFSYRDRPSRQGEIHLRTQPGAETRLTAEVRRIIGELDPSLALYNVRTLNDHIETNLVFRRIPARMFVVLGPLLVALAGIGISAVVAYTVSQRTMEIGIRLALGARGGQVVAQFIAETGRVIALGASAGWVLALMLDRTVREGTPFDARVFVAVPALLLSVALLACWLPARRATEVDPVHALRQE